MSLNITPAEIVARAEACGRPGLLARAPHWDRVRLGDVADVVNGAAFPSSGFNSERRGTPLIRIRDVGRSETATWFDGPSEARYFVRNGDILVGMDGDFRVARWRGGDALLNQRVCRIDVDEARYSSRLLVLVLQGYLNAVWAETSSVTVKHLSSRTIADIPLPRPPSEEQRRIAALLEDHLSRLHAAKESLARSLVRLEALGDSMLAEALRAAIDDQESETHTLGDIAKVGTGLTPLKGNKAFYSNGTIPWITSGDLHQGLITEATQFVTQKALDQTSLKLVPSGALLLAMYGEGKTRGTAAELAIDATTNQACASIVLKDPGLRSWVRLVLDANYTSMRRLAAGGVQPNLNLSLVRAIRIPIPSERTRLQLQARITEVDVARTRLQMSLRAAEQRGAALRRSLLSAAFSGSLTSQTSNIEALDRKELR